MMTTSVEPRTSRPVHIGVGTRIRARLFAARWDQQIERAAPGTAVIADSPLAAHMRRITSRGEREQLADALNPTRRSSAGGVSFRVPVHAAALSAAADLIDELTFRLRGPQPVRVRGMARLRILLADGRGPFYRPGPASLNAALRGVLAAL